MSPVPAPVADQRPFLRVVTDSDVAASVGEVLRAARIRANMSLEEAAVATKVRVHFLQSLEDMNIGALPERAYAVGFLKAYAGVLGLDADLLAARFKAETQGPEPEPEDSFAVIRRSFVIPRGAGIAAGLIALAVVFAGWRGLMAPTNADPIPQSTVDWAADPYAPPPSAPFALSAPVPAPAQPVVAPNGIATGVIILRATKDVKLTIRTAKGAILYTHEIKTGETYKVPSTPGLVASSSAPGAIEVLVDGQSAGKLSAADVALDALR